MTNIVDIETSDNAIRPVLLGGEEPSLIARIQALEDTTEVLCVRVPTWSTFEEFKSLPDFKYIEAAWNPEPHLEITLCRPIYCNSIKEGELYRYKTRNVIDGIYETYAITNNGSIPELHAPHAIYRTDTYLKKIRS